MKNITVLDNEEFKSSVEAVMKYLAENHHPHTKVIIDSDSAELVEGLATHRTEKFIKD
ncbi:hypothetical protein [unidentified bacterial endosymbiont]|uniref:hypothetical protein n=1 Tax=unidentified bacterial endosymbiont TaxID=2355 RepID=UPI00209FE311|nr:hypothetical protein [unidentified bacterial endosymbiont]